MSGLKVLAADIGGTNSRFAEVEVSMLSNIRMSDPVIFPTDSESVNCFEDLLEHYLKVRPDGLTALEEYDALGIAIAGGVDGPRGNLPNISWDIDFSTSKPVENVFLLNDFVAQAYGYLGQGALEALQLIRSGSRSGTGAIAIVGAGTGLGHAALEPHKGERAVISSEAGHASFSFHGEDELRIEAFMMAARGKHWLSSDDVTTGSGAALIHEALTGEKATPAEALNESNKDSLTCKYYSRFYARACRNYCLSMYPVEALIITGGVAAKNPHLVKSDDFIDEFNDGHAYSHLLKEIPIYLNTDEAVGIKGAAIYAWQQLIDP